MDPKNFLDDKKDQRLDELFDFLRFPSISARSEHKPDIKACAEWLANHMTRIGIESRIIPTQGHPVVYGSLMTSPKNITVLYYGHYDVQPVDPLDLWKTKPFEPTLVGEYIMGRGTTDDKGQLFTHLKAVEAYTATSTPLPVNLKFMFEGEEESGSEHTEQFIKENAELLKADIVVVSDTAQYGKNIPAVTYGLRGLGFVEVKVTGPNRDLHSGSFGGAIANPINVLSEIIAKLHDKNGKVAIPGFYKDVKPITAWEKKQIKRLPFTVKDFLAKTGSKGIHGEKGYSTLEQIWSRPTLDINGITGGYQGEGGKTIIPSWASCKITMRLVPHQKPNDICNKAEKYIKKICPKYVTCEVIKHGGAPGVVVPTDGPWLAAAGKAIKKGFGKEPVYIKEGGSIPVVGTFKNVLGADTLLLGWGQNDDNAHSPNERFSVKDFERGCYSALALIDELARVK
ncbi:ArgE/DapE/Acy1 family protein [Candidatus Zixiibacteriota bacterium]|nr:ArgE/DapE/Acy1 family protein [candidate division Zixibacteria bacterium]